MNKRICSILLAGALALSCTPLAAFAEEPAADSTAVLTAEAEPPAETPEAPADAAEAAVPEAAAAEAPAAEQSAGDEDQDSSLMYVALGDSLVAGVGLNDFSYDEAELFVDVSPNFKGYSSTCYVAYVADALGLDRDHAINLGLPALQTKDLVEMIRDGKMSEFNQPAGTYFVYPEFQDYIREADIITVQIGANDAMVPFIVSLGEATNWKSEQLANAIVAGTYRDFSFENLSNMVSQVLDIKLTGAETRALFTALTSGMNQICDNAYTTAQTYLPQVVSAIRELNPDAEILLLGANNPVPLLSSWSRYFNNYNSFARQLAADTGCIYVPIPRTQTANDGHPTVKGHKYIANQILKALEE